jgi:hypothetical protein
MWSNSARGATRARRDAPVVGAADLCRLVEEQHAVVGECSQMLHSSNGEGYRCFLAEVVLPIIRIPKLDCDRI